MLKEETFKMPVIKPQDIGVSEWVSECVCERGRESVCVYVWVCHKAALAEEACCLHFFLSPGKRELFPASFITLTDTSDSQWACLPFKPIAWSCMNTHTQDAPFLLAISAIQQLQMEKLFV